tara:strand:+ start:62 stop:175 length:114 start_codon:yes stop_codon:yes gene_type:complete
MDLLTLRIDITLITLLATKKGGTTRKKLVEEKCYVSN